MTIRALRSSLPLAPLLGSVGCACCGCEADDTYVGGIPELAVGVGLLRLGSTVT